MITPLLGLLNDSTRACRQRIPMRYFFLWILSALLVSGCAVTPSQTTELQKYLGEPCYELITKPGVANYKYHATHFFPLVHSYFALASDGKDRQVCSFSTTTEGLGRDNHNKIVALSRCESLRSQYGIQSPCRIFAKNYEIVYDKTSSFGME